jgi:hypothetical protein
MGGGCFFVHLLLALTEALCTFFALLISCLCLSLSLCVCVVCCDCELIPIYFYLVFFIPVFANFNSDVWFSFSIWKTVGGFCEYGLEKDKKNRLHPSIYHENPSENLCCLSVYALTKQASYHYSFTKPQAEKKGIKR